MPLCSSHLTKWRAQPVVHIPTRTDDDRATDGQRVGQRRAHGPLHAAPTACGMDSRAPALFPSQVDKCDPSAMAPGVAKLLAWVTATVLLAGTPGYARATEPIRIAPDLDQAEVYFKTVNDLASDDGDDDKKPRKALSTYLKGSRGKEIEKCARKCTSTCIRGGQGAPGLGPLSVRKELVVFKSGYRSGSYCLSECVQICALELGQK